ncbi:MAG: alcohol dehydrogenase catalytic domain-containing protein [Spirochaetales bacterium]|uniref:Alcohol dehydrogenase catalytic domain-containing protein n=1 Tax=Candidatus Thalassospirochaeta sargassi TaxID=3119039 RepID=A0AAJ1IC84_9SPIO|nr:alcohol dehydrogenase catalytic domain-containing protein [Spirochaetales bacterium]
MKSAVLMDARSIEIMESEIPECGDCEVLVRVKYCGICTLEQRLWAGDMKIYYPLVPGHEVSGVVEKVGKGVKSALKAGDRVALDMVYRCHQCYYCRTGQSNLCENQFTRGVTPLGGFSDYVVVAPERVFTIADNLSLEEAAFAEPVACCLRSLKKLNLTIAEDILIVGAGPMGLMHLQVALAMGVRVFISDVDDSRLATAAELGADFTINPVSVDAVEAVRAETAGRGVDACVVTSPAIPALEAAFKSIRKNGRINIYTAYMQEKPHMPIDMNRLHRSEVLVTGTEGRTEFDFQQAVRLLDFGRVNVKPLITRIAGFSDIEDGIKAAMSTETQRVLLGTEK